MITVRTVVIKRIKAKRGYKYDTFMVYTATAHSDVLKQSKVESRMKELCVITYDNSNMKFKFRRNIGMMSEYMKNKMSSILWSKEFIDGLLKFKYDSRISEVTVYVSNMPNSLLGDIEHAWSNF